MQDENALNISLTGTYTLEFTGRFGNTDSYQFQVINVPINPPTPVNLSQYVSGSISVPGQLDFYTFSANAGQLIYLQQFNGFLPFTFMNVTIFKPDGSTLIGATPYDVDTFALTQTGTVLRT